MHETRDNKKSILTEISERLKPFTAEQMAAKQAVVEQKLLEFANFLEAERALLYLQRAKEMATENIIRISLTARKGIVLPSFSESRHAISLFQITDLDADVKKKANCMEPDPVSCKKVALEEIDIAIIPGFAFDEKGGRIGFGDGFYNRLIAKLPETTRKIAIAFEEQVVEHVPMESRKHNLDIIITDQRTIYKI